MECLTVPGGGQLSGYMQCGCKPTWEADVGGVASTAPLFSVLYRKMILLLTMVGGGGGTVTWLL